MRRLSSLPRRRLLRAAMAVTAVAIVLVPAIARAQQRVEHGDATRLSIRQSWLGVAPPTKATVAPQPIVVLPAVVAEPEPQVIARRAPVATEGAPRPVLSPSPDPLRGPPSPALL